MNHFDGSAPTLHHVCLRSEHPEQLIAFYADVMGLRFSTTREAHLGTAEHRRLVIERGPSKTLGYGAFSFANRGHLAAFRDRLAKAQIEFSTSPSPFFDDTAFAVRDPDGNLLVFGVGGESADASESTDYPPARLQHLVVASDQLPALREFYVDVLGFGVADEVHAEDGDVTASFLHSNHEHHSFAVFRAPEKRLDHHSYEVDDWNAIRDWCDHFAAHDHMLHWGPGRHGAGNNLFAMVTDPDGNWIEVSAELETITPERATKRWEHGPRPLNLWGHAKLRS